MFQYSRIRLMGNERIYLKVIYLHNQKGVMGNYPFYGFAIYISETHERVGELTLRIGTVDQEDSPLYYDGNIAYGIDKQFRGNGYATDAVELAKFYAKYHHIDKLWIVCNINNIASIKVIKKLNGVFFNEITIPEDMKDEHDEVLLRNRYFIGV